MAAHSSVLAWRIPGTAELGGLPSMGSHRVRHDGSDLAATGKGLAHGHRAALCLSPRSTDHPHHVSNFLLHCNYFKDINMCMCLLLPFWSACSEELSN